MTTIRVEELPITHPDGPAPRALLRRPADRRRRPAVLLLHGFKGFRDWGFFPHLGESLAAAGFAAVSVDFALNGIGDEAGEFTRLDLFERNCLTAELDDIRVVIDALERRSDVDGERIGLLGHSRGGAVALLAAREQPRIRAIATLAAVTVWQRHFSAAEWREWGRVGYAEVVNARTGQVMRIGRAVRDEIADPSGRFDPLVAAAAVDAPLLVIHGTADLSVSVQDAHDLVAARRKRPTELLLVEGADHVFGAVHPWSGSTPHIDATTDRVIAFLEDRFGPTAG